MTRAIILTGADRYDGKWHDHPATSQRIAEVLAEMGIDARLRASHPRAFGELAGADLLVVNTANGAPAEGDATDADWGPAWAALADYLGSGKPVLAMHLASSSFIEVPAWRKAIGGAWIIGTSMHPPLSETTLKVHTDAHPIVARMSDFTVTDERYSYLTEEPGNVTLVSHTHDDLEHPIAWAREGAHGRAVYDALGHDVRSYDSEGRVELLRREVRWLLEG